MRTVHLTNPAQTVEDGMSELTDEEQRDFDMHICQCRSCEKGLELERLSYIREGVRAAREVVRVDYKHGPGNERKYDSVEDYLREKEGA